MSWYDVFFAKGQDLDLLETGIRTVLVFLITLAAIRIAKKRFLGKNTAFDVILGIIAGSVVSRAINGSGKFFHTMISLLILVGMHWLISALISRNDKLADIIEGTSALLVKNGKIDQAALAAHHFREYDLVEAARLKGHINDISKIKEANLETNGEISIVKE